MKIKYILGFQKKIWRISKKTEVKFKKSNPNELEGEEKKFMRGAEIAYETIITAFAKG